MPCGVDGSTRTTCPVHTRMRLHSRSHSPGYGRATSVARTSSGPSATDRFARTAATSEKFHHLRIPSPPQLATTAHSRGFTSHAEPSAYTGCSFVHSVCVVLLITKGLALPCLGAKMGTHRTEHEERYRRNREGNAKHARAPMTAREQECDPIAGRSQSSPTDNPQPISRTKPDPPRGHAQASQRKPSVAGPALRY